MLDLTPREKPVFAPLLMLVLWMGIYPELVPGADPADRRCPRRPRRRRAEAGARTPRPTRVIPAKAGIRLSSDRTADKWVPVFAGTTRQRIASDAPFPFPAISPALPEIVLVCAAMALLLIGVFRGEGSARLVSWLAVVVLLVTLVLCGVFGWERRLGFYGMFVTDAFAVFMKALVLLGAAVSIILALRFNEEHRIARFEFPVLILLASTGMMLMVSANDLITLYLGLELQSLSLYVVASFDRDSVRSTEAGLKYFVLGALASGMLLYGASLIYGFAGTTEFRRSGAACSAPARRPSAGLIIGIVFVTVGLAFKVSAVPFHMWTPDVYEGAPTPVTAFFSVAPKIAAVALFVRFMIEPFGGLLVEWRQVIVFLSVASMVLGAVAAIAQDQYQAADGLQLDRPCRLRADRPRRGDPDRHPRRPRLYGDLPVHESRHLGRDPVHAAEGADARRHIATCPVSAARSRVWRWRSASSCSRWPASRRPPASSPSSTSFSRRSTRT